MKKFVTAGIVLAASATVVLLNTTTDAMACTGILCPPPDVPEIDALAGTAALAAIGASVALVWERRRRK